MALKPDCKILDGEDISYFMYETAEAGSCLTFSGSGGAGGAMDDPDAVVIKSTGVAGNPAGMLINNVVNIDLTRYKLNEHKNEVQVGSKVQVLRHGYATTNMLAAGITPSAGSAAHFTGAGTFTTATSSTKVGQFLSRKDSDGYAKLEINIT